MRFSQRYGYLPIKNAFQREAVDDALRTKLWNILSFSIWKMYNPSNRGYDETTKKIDGLLDRLWFHFFNKDLDELPDFRGRFGNDGAYDVLKRFFMSCYWHQVYDFLEVIANDQSELVSADLRGFINTILEEQNAAYRFVEKRILEITDNNEIQSIETAIASSDAPVRAHLNAALRMLSDKDAPDSRNSVKESISAVEAICRLVTTNESATLGAALKRVENLNPAMSKAFSQLYGYTNDASGIRHSLIDQDTVTYADAKFMLVTCSAFVSYLKSEISVKNVS